MNYEKNIKRLDEILSKISSPDTPLDESIKLYEEGKKICTDIQKVLTELEGKITVLTSEGELPIQDSL